MKSPSILGLLGVMACFANLVLAQEAKPQAKKDYQRGTMLLSEVSDGTPFLPAPQPPPIDYQILSTDVRQLKDRTVTLHRVAPPILPAPQARPVPVDDTPPELLALFEEKGEIMLSLSATVYDSGVTSLRWQHGGQAYHAWSNINFFHLQGVGIFLVDGQPYSLNMGLGGAALEDLTEFGQTVTIPDLPKNHQSFLITEGDPANQEARRGLEALHKLYATEGAKLAAAYAKRQRAQQASEEVRKNAPPKSKDSVVYFWLPPESAARLKEPTQAQLRPQPAPGAGGRPASPIRDALRAGDTAILDKSQPKGEQP